MRWLSFSRSRSADSTAELSNGNDAGLHISPRFVLDADMLSDVGCARSNNEDSGRLFRDFNADGGVRMLVVVADGMGGHNAGERASATAVAVIEAAYPEMRTEPADRLKDALQRRQLYYP